MPCSASPLAAGLDYDGAALRWRASPAAGGLAEHGMRGQTCSQAALSTACLMLARNAATAATLRALAQPDCLETFAVQFEDWRWGKRAVWTPDVAVRQPFSEASLQAAAADGRERLLDNLLTPDAHRYAPESRFGRAQRTLSKRRPRVVALTRDDWAASQYRVHQPLADLHGAGLIETPQVARVRQMRAPGLLDVAALDADAVVFHHCFDDASLQLLDDLAKRTSCARVIVVDDLLTAVPEYNPMRANVFADIEQRLQRALAACTCLVVTSAGLAQAYGGLAKRVVVIENALPQAPWSSLARKLPHAAPARRLRVGWAGAQQHSGDLELLDHLLRTFTSVQWVFLGMAPAAARDTDAEIHAMVPFADYPARLAQLDLDLALAPLLDNPFNRCKSALKLIEFGALGIPVIASDVAPYQNAPVHRVDNTPQAWSSALDALLRDAALRAECALTLQQWAWSRHRLIDRRAAWLDALGLAGTA